MAVFMQEIDVADLRRISELIYERYNYDFRKLVRDICTSRTYQLSTRANDTNANDTRNFARGAIRRIRAEVMLDCITQVTEGKQKYQGLPLGARAQFFSVQNATLQPHDPS